MDSKDHSALVLLHLWTKHGAPGQTFAEWLYDEMTMSIARWKSGDFEQYRALFPPPSKPPVA